MPIDLLLEDGPVLAVHKPAGILTQGVPIGLPSLEWQVKAYLKERYHKPGNVYLGIPHRLDRPVSGVVLFSRNSKAARRLAEQFQRRQVRKLYWAVLERAPDPPGGALHDWLIKRAEQARVEIGHSSTPGARPCSLTYRTLGLVDAGALVEIELGTGRMHQIRVQFGSRGWPIVGDWPYGASDRMSSTTDAAVSAEDGSGATAPERCERIALHARQLTFLHPVRYDPVTVVAPLPDCWRKLGTDPFHRSDSADDATPQHTQGQARPE